MSEQATPLFRTARTTPAPAKREPQHRRDGYFDDSDLWHDSVDESSARSTA